MIRRRAPDRGRGLARRGSRPMARKLLILPVSQAGGRPDMRHLNKWLGGVAMVAMAVSFAAPAGAADPVKIGLVAALSGQAAKSGEGITRGLSVAIDEINAKG